jgi:uncharacterized protein (DUF1330 family)
MDSKLKMMLVLATGVALGAAGMHGLHAQAKPKAYSVSELETIDAAVQAAYVPLVRAAVEKAGARRVNNAGGKIVALVGTAPKRVAINEWETLEKAQAFYTSKAWTDLAPQRDKAQKTVRSYIIESAN